MRRFLNKLFIIVFGIFAVLVFISICISFYLKHFGLERDVYEIEQSAWYLSVTRVRPSSGKLSNSKKIQELPVVFSHTKRVGELYCEDGSKIISQNQNRKLKKITKKLRVRYSLFFSYVLSCERKYINAPDSFSVDEAVKSSEYGEFIFIRVKQESFGGFISGDVYDVMKIKRYDLMNKDYGYRSRYKVIMKNMNADAYLDFNLTQYYNRVVGNKMNETIKAENFIWSQTENRFVTEPVDVSTKTYDLEH